LHGLEIAADALRHAGKHPLCAMATVARSPLPIGAVFSGSVAFPSSADAGASSPKSPI
jgi:hypothetical protein